MGAGQREYGLIICCLHRGILPVVAPGINPSYLNLRVTTLSLSTTKRAG